MIKYPKNWLICNSCGEFFTEQMVKEGDTCPECNNGNLFWECVECNKKLKDCMCKKLNFKNIEEIGDLEKLKPVTQISGICFDKNGKILIVSDKNGKWGLPGGKPEKGESYEQTLIREVSEEANVEINQIKPLGFVEVNYPKNPNKIEGELFYQGRFFALVKKINEMKKDPATGNLFERKFVDEYEFLDLIKWENAAELLELGKHAFKRIREIKK